MKRKQAIATREAECAFLTSLFKTHNVAVHASIRSALGSLYEYLADEVVGDLWLIACKKIKFVMAHENPAGWLIVTARYIACNAVRHYRNEHCTYSLSDIGDVPSYTDIFDEAFHKIEDDDEIIESVLSVLTKRERELYKLIFVDKMTTEEISKKHDISPSTIRNLKKRIVDKINDAVNEHFD